MTVSQVETITRQDAGYESARVDRIFNKRRPEVYPERIMFATSVQDGKTQVVVCYLIVPNIFSSHSD